MAKLRTLYVIVDETGMDLEFHHTLKSFRDSFRWWSTKGGIEPSSRTINYIPTNKGVAALLNSLKQDVG